jgi:hypothetical protein
MIKIQITILLSVLVLGATSSNGALAQEQQQPDRSDTRNKNDKNTTEGLDKETQSEKNDRNRVFKPSEEISEDVAVDFPIDI